MMALSPRSRICMATVLFPLLACAGTDSMVEGGLDGPDRLLNWEREIVHSVGGFEATAWDAFGDVGGVGFDAAGNIYILDTQAFSVSVVGPDGELVRSFGSQGEGPGELQRPESIAVFPDGSVAIYDMGKFGFVTYGADGEWLRDVTASDPGNIELLGNLTAAGPGLESGGSVIAERVGRIRMSSGGGDVDASVGLEPEGDPVVRVELNDALDPAVVFRAWEPPEPVGPDQEVGGSAEGGSSFQIRMGPLRAFTPDLNLAALPDGRFAVSDSTTYRIRIFQPDGTESGEITRSIDPVLVTPQIETREQTRRRDELEAQMAEGGRSESVGRVVVLGGSGGGSMNIPDMSQARLNQIENMVFYPEIPAISALAADWEGRIWIQRPGQELGERGPIDIITVDGAYVGTLSPEGPETPVAFGPNGLAAWIEVDDLDVETVVVARIIDRSSTS